MALEFLDLNNKSQVDEYERFVKSCDKGHFAQSVMWARIKTDWKFEAVIVRGEDGAIIGSMGVLVRRVPLFRANMMYSPRGPVCDIHDKAVISALMDLSLIHIYLSIFSFSISSPSRFEINSFSVRRFASRSSELISVIESKSQNCKKRCVALPRSAPVIPF